MNKLTSNQNAYAQLSAYLSRGRLPHAILVEGVKGCGKLVFATEIAQGALCTAEKEIRPCGICKNCIKVERNVHPDISVYSGAGGNLSFHIDTVRELRKDAYIMPNEADYKIIILKNINEMTIQSQNALLKIVEEPPANLIFIMLCENKSLLLETILSRVSTIKLDKVEATIENKEALELLESICFGNELGALANLSKIERDKEVFMEILTQLATETQMIILGMNDKDIYKQISHRVSPLQMLGILDIIEESKDAVNSNVNRLLIATNLCAKIKLTLS